MPGAGGQSLEAVEFDALTGLPGRARGHAGLERSLAEAQARTGAPWVAVALLDVERLRAVNAARGVAAGDRVLRDLAQRLEAGLSRGDVLARVGSDEFLVALPRADREAALASAAALRERASEAFGTDGGSVRVRIRLGVALHPEHGADAATLLRRADLALDAAREGRVESVVYRAGEDEKQRRRHVIGLSLHAAAASGQLHLEYQPKLELPSRRIEQVEALLRWRHPELGALQPGEFIAVAERTGQVGPLTRFVLEAALRQLRAWREAGLALGVAVNVSALDLSAPELPGVVAGLLREHGVDAGSLTLEITESAAMGDPEMAGEALARLASLGVRLSLDDFGVGHSSFARLQGLPVHELKIDRCFVSSLRPGSEDAPLLRSLIALGHGLHLRVVAEGVEHAATLRRLAALGCDAAQGFAVSPPVCPEALEALCRARRPMGRRAVGQAASSTRSAPA